MPSLSCYCDACGSDRPFAHPKLRVGQSPQNLTGGGLESGGSPRRVKMLLGTGGAPCLFPSPEPAPELRPASVGVFHKQASSEMPHMVLLEGSFLLILQGGVSHPLSARPCPALLSGSTAQRCGVLSVPHVVLLACLPVSAAYPRVGEPRGGCVLGSHSEPTVPCPCPPGFHWKPTLPKPPIKLPRPPVAMDSPRPVPIARLERGLHVRLREATTW